MSTVLGKDDTGGQRRMQYAYIRVSTKEQNIDRQMLALEPYHIPKKNIYCDYQSGKDFQRPEYQKLACKVTAISASAFKNNTTLKTGVIRNDVTKIGNKAFAGTYKKAIDENIQ